jgi:hypothetical protein
VRAPVPGTRSPGAGPVPLLLAAALLAACGTTGPASPSPESGPAAAPPPESAPADAAAALAASAVTVAADRADLVVPLRLERLLVREPGGPPWVVRVGEFRVECREERPRVTVAGEDLSVVAVGGVRIARDAGTRRMEEGPFTTAVFRNGEVLLR